MMNANVDIINKNYSDTEIIIFVKRDGKNLFMDMGICQFNNEMENWGMPTKSGVLEGDIGFIFSKDIDLEEIEMEINRFIIHNEI